MDAANNLLGTGCLAAAIGLKKYLTESGKEGTVIFYGCPAEEAGGGKTFMAREGCFDHLDAAIAWHPGRRIWKFRRKYTCELSDLFPL